MNLADALNLGCMCQTLSPDRLREQLETDPSLAGLTQQLAASHPHLFSDTAVFLDAGTRDALAATVSAITGSSAFSGAAGSSRAISADGPHLIEINTNAGGALLNAALARAHRACCDSMRGLFYTSTDLLHLDETFLAMFRAEWRAQRGEVPLRTVLIVDDAPDTQYLAPEFALARQLFLQHGITTAVADARELQWHDGALWHSALPAGQPVDLIYNRLTDFDLSDPAHAALREAYVAGGAVVTPHPRAHALFADKRNLVTLGDDALLGSWGVSPQDRRILQAAIPRTVQVTQEQADALWARRRQLFFKPVAGYGAKAAYRGDKLTRRVWSDILAGDFVAQDLVPPSERLVEVNGQPQRLKLDLRAYTWLGQIQLLAARTWTGQTTNFRTPGGGFSPVVVLPSLEPAAPGIPSTPHSDNHVLTATP